MKQRGLDGKYYEVDPEVVKRATEEGVPYSMALQQSEAQTKVQAPSAAEKWVDHLAGRIEVVFEVNDPSRSRYDRLRDAIREDLQSALEESRKEWEVQYRARLRDSWRVQEKAEV